MKLYLTKETISPEYCWKECGSDPALFGLYYMHLRETSFLASPAELQVLPCPLEPEGTQNTGFGSATSSHQTELDYFLALESMNKRSISALRSFRHIHNLVSSKISITILLNKSF